MTIEECRLFTRFYLKTFVFLPQQKVSDKISTNSLITSVIENIPKVIDSCQPTDNNDEELPPSKTADHGEDRTIIYLPKDRTAAETKSVECQTNISLIQQTKASRYRRRRRESSSSDSSGGSRSSSGSSSCDRSRYDNRLVDEES